MSGTVDGPAADALNDPNALEIAHLQLRIGQFEEAKAHADGSHKKALFEGQIVQLKAQQAILYNQMTGVPPKGDPFDRAAIEGNLVAQQDQLKALPALVGGLPQAPVKVRIEELDQLIAAVKRSQAPAMNAHATARTSK